VAPPPIQSENMAGEPEWHPKKPISQRELDVLNKFLHIKWPIKNTRSLQVVQIDHTKVCQIKKKPRPTLSLLANP